MSRKTNSFVAAATAAAVTITGLGFEQAIAAPAAPREAKQAVIADTTPTDISAAKRKRVYRRSGADAAAIATMLGIIGTTVAIASANRKRRHYYHPYGYHYAPYPAYGYYRPYGHYRPHRPYPYYGGYRYW